MLERGARWNPPAVSPLNERFEVEGFAVGENLQRNAVYRAELLHALDQVGQLADLVLAFVRRALGRGGEDAETEDINEIVVVHASAIDPLFRAAEELRRENAALRKKVDDLHRRSLTSEA